MPEKPKFQGFVECVPKDAIKEAVNEDKRSITKLFETIQELAEHGYKFALRWSDYHDAYQASLYAESRSNPNAGWILTAQHVDATKAIKLLLVTHEVQDGDWQHTPQNDVDW